MVDRHFTARRDNPVSRLPLTGKELWYLVGLTALVLAGFIGALYIFALILQGVFR
jgi:hypothetical protein